MSIDSEHGQIIRSFKGLPGRVAIYGGSFDPIHNGHVALAETVRDTLKLDSVVFIPAFQNPLKTEAPSASSSDRVEMISLAISGHDRLQVSRIELDRGGASYTIQTLRQIRSELPAGGAVFLVLGIDQLPGIKFWRDYQSIPELAQIVFVERAGVTLKVAEQEAVDLPVGYSEALKRNFIPFNNPVSSTVVRDLIQRRDDKKLSGLLSDQVLALIKSKGLYGYSAL